MEPCAKGNLLKSARTVQFLCDTKCCFLTQWLCCLADCRLSYSRNVPLQRQFWLTVSPLFPQHRFTPTVWILHISSRFPSSQHLSVLSYIKCADAALCIQLIWNFETPCVRIRAKAATYTILDTNNSGKPSSLPGSQTWIKYCSCKCKGNHFQFKRTPRHLFRQTTAMLVLLIYLIL